MASLYFSALLLCTLRPNMEADWDAEDFEPAVPVPVSTAVVSDKWEGEDEDEPVKESWEDEETENKSSEAKPQTTATKKKSSKKLEEKIAERERKSREEAEERRRLMEANMTPEERIAEKLRRQKLVEDADFELAKETFGVSAPRPGSLDDANPTTKEEFTEFKNNLVKKIQSLSSKTCYNEFIEDFVKDICIGLEVEVLRKVSQTSKALHEEKSKMVKAATKGGKKGKTKVTLKMDRGMDTFTDDYGGGDYDDFM
uniref:Eukaryotic translation initiation factor 3 subunit J n=1 Tax=Scapholeberis mucronata TaxID=202097 RepID=A0A4Y7NLC1_9CRUS|nr:EOG090X0OQM [Scapholeberis mucronata]SVE94051.1 EOG090X0OQM [Scapholeberis mucronata]